MLLQSNYPPRNQLKMSLSKSVAGAAQSTKFSLFALRNNKNNKKCIIAGKGSVNSDYRGKIYVIKVS